MLRDILHSFARGARLGLLVAGSALVLALGAGVAALDAEASEARPVTAATLDPTFEAHVAVAGAFEPPELSADDEAEVVEHLQAVLTLDDVDLSALDAALEEARETPATATPLPAAPADDATPAAPAPAPTQQAAPTSPPAARVSIDTGTLYSLIASAFPEQPEKAYSVVMCESSGNPGVNTGNGYYGLWQFDLATWQSVGGSGLPSNASADEQIARARMLYESRGWQPWGCA